MPYISKCSGGDCPVKNKCFRYTNNVKQSTINPPYKITGKFKNNVECDLFWNENQTNILNQLKEIVNGKKEY